MCEGKEQGQDESARYRTACQSDEQPQVQRVCRLWQCSDDGPLGGFPIKGELFPCKHFYHFHHPWTDLPATARPPNPFSCLLNQADPDECLLLIPYGAGNKHII